MDRNMKVWWLKTLKKNEIYQVVSVELNMIWVFYKTNGDLKTPLKK